MDPSLSQAAQQHTTQSAGPDTGSTQPYSESSPAFREGASSPDGYGHEAGGNSVQNGDPSVSPVRSRGANADWRRMAEATSRISDEEKVASVDSSASTHRDPRWTRKPGDLKCAVFSTTCASVTALASWTLYGFAVELGVVGPGMLSPATAIIGTRAHYVFAIGWLGRVLGALLFGHFGDRVSRRCALSMSLGVVGVTTLLIGCIPVHDGRRPQGPAYWVEWVLRFLQGVGLGGQLSGSIIIPFEVCAPLHQRYLATSVPMAGAWLGVALGCVLSLASIAMARSGHMWMWNLSFLICGAVALPNAAWLALRIPDAYEVVNTEEVESLACCPLLDALWLQGRAMFASLLIFAIDDMTLVLVFLTMGTRIQQTDALLSNLAILAGAMGVVAVVTVISGALNERCIPQRALYVAASLLAGAASVIWLWLRDPTKAPPASTYGLILIFAPALGLLQGPIPSILCEMFRPQMRYTGSGMIYTLSHLVFESAFPPLARTLFEESEKSDLQLPLPGGRNALGLAIIILCLALLSAFSASYVLKYHLSGLDNQQQLLTSHCVTILPPRQHSLSDAHEDSSYTRHPYPYPASYTHAPQSPAKLSHKSSHGTSRPGSHTSQPSSSRSNRRSSRPGRSVSRLDLRVALRSMSSESEGGRRVDVRVLYDDSRMVVPSSVGAAEERGARTTGEEP